jgi:transposase InsO family protein
VDGVLAPSHLSRKGASGNPGAIHAFIESFNGRVRDECLNQYRFLTLPDARRIIDAYRIHCLTKRRHNALGDRTPSEFAATFVKQYFTPSLTS